MSVYDIRSASEYLYVSEGELFVCIYFVSVCAHVFSILSLCLCVCMCTWYLCHFNVSICVFFVYLCVWVYLWEMYARMCVRFRKNVNGKVCISVRVIVYVFHVCGCSCLCISVYMSVSCVSMFVLCVFCYIGVYLCLWLCMYMCL